jgi:hypothetical protein
MLTSSWLLAVRVVVARTYKGINAQGAAALAVIEHLPGHQEAILLLNQL